MHLQDEHRKKEEQKLQTARMSHHTSPFQLRMVLTTNGFLQQRKTRFPLHCSPAPVVIRRTVIPRTPKYAPRRGISISSPPLPGNASRFLSSSACDSASNAPSPPAPLDLYLQAPPCRRSRTAGRERLSGAGRCQPVSPACPGRAPPPAPLRPRQEALPGCRRPPPARGQPRTPGRAPGPASAGCPAGPAVRGTGLSRGEAHPSDCPGPAMQASKLTRARSPHGARRFVVKPGMPTALLTPQHNRAAVSTGAPCQLSTLACPNQCPSALPASASDNNSCCHRQPWCHKHPPAPITPGCC